MRTQTPIAAVGLIATLAACAAALGATTRAASDPGVTPTTILLGATTPLTGPAAAYQSVARGANAYFQYVNSRGGVLGRKITYTYLDD
jgi:branched-chain amino acid transport system substrate-binding protein